MTTGIYSRQPEENLHKSFSLQHHVRMQNSKPIWWPRKTKGVSSKEGKKEREVCKFLIIANLHTMLLDLNSFCFCFFIKIAEKKASYKKKKTIN